MKVQRELLITNGVSRFETHVLLSVQEETQLISFLQDVGFSSFSFLTLDLHLSYVTKESMSRPHGKGLPDCETLISLPVYWGLY